MQTGSAADVGAILNRDVTCQHDLIGDADVIAQDAVMRDVDGDHDQVVVAHAGDAAAVAGSAMNRYVFANLVAVAYFKNGALAAELAVLRIGANDREGVKDVVAPNRGERLNGNMVVQHRAVVDGDFGAHDAIRADNDAVSQVCGRINDRG